MEPSSLPVWLVSRFSRMPDRMLRSLVYASTGENACAAFAIAHGLAGDARGICARPVHQAELAEWQLAGWPAMERL